MPWPWASWPMSIPYCSASIGLNVEARLSSEGKAVTPPAPAATPTGPSRTTSGGMHRRGTPGFHSSILFAGCGCSPRKAIFSWSVISWVSCAASAAGCGLCDGMARFHRHGRGGIGSAPDGRASATEPARTSTAASTSRGRPKRRRPAAMDGLTGRRGLGLSARASSQFCRIETLRAVTLAQAKKESVVALT